MGSSTQPPVNPSHRRRNSSLGPLREEPEPPRPLHLLGDARPAGRRPRAPPPAPRRPPAGPPTGGVEEVRPVEARSIPSPWQSLPGPSRIAPRHRASAPRHHQLAGPGAPRRLGAAPPRPARGAADDVRAVVDPVAQVHVEVARLGRTSCGCAGRGPAVGMARGVVGPVVGLDLDEAHGDRRPRRSVAPRSATATAAGSPSSSSRVTRSRAQRGAAGRRAPVDAVSAASSAARWATAGSGPAPPGVVRRATAAPGSRSSAASGPRPSAAATARARPRPRRATSATSAPTRRCASRNGTPRPTSHSARSTAARGRVVGGLGHARGVEPRRRVAALQRGERAEHLADRVEEGLFVLLEVAVVRERQALQRREQPRSGCR